MKETKNTSPQIPILVGLIIFGGWVGFAVIIYDFVKRSEFSPSENLNLKQISKPIIYFLIGLIVINLVFQALTTFEGYENLGGIVMLAQLFVAIALINKTLHPANVYITNPKFWDQAQNLDFTTLVTSNTEGRNSGKDSTSRAASLNRSQSAAMSSVNQSRNPLLVDQSGDKNRVLLIFAAILFLLIFLAYQYWANNSDQVMTWVNQFLQSTMVEPPA